MTNGTGASRPGSRASARTLAAALLTAALFAALAAAPATAESLTLRVNDVSARPGGVAAVVVRTYAPRGVTQGQLCLRGTPARRSKTTGEPFAALESYVVFSAAGDAVAEGTFTTPTQTAVLAFESLSGGINQDDGPVAVLYFRLAASTTAGEVFEIAIDPAETFLFDAAGAAVEIEPRAGELEVLAAGDPTELEAEGDEVPPGRVARLAVSTSETFPIAQGQAAFRYDPAIAAGAPVVAMDPRHGSASFAVDDSTPGLVLVTFDSVDLSLNSVPGGLISIDLATSSSVPLDTRSAVSLDPAQTYLIDPGGASLTLALEAGEIVFVPETPLFADGFESGDTGAWSRARP